MSYDPTTDPTITMAAPVHTGPVFDPASAQRGAEVIGDVVRGAVVVGAISGGLSYYGSRDVHKAVRAAGWGAGLYLALVFFMVTAVFCGVLGLALLAGGSPAGLMLFVVTALCVWACVAVCRSTYQRGQDERWFVNDNASARPGRY